MTNYTIKQINTFNVIEGMELADDVIYSNGLLLFPKGTVLTDRHILKLNLYKIKYVYIKDFIQQPTFSRAPLQQPIIDEQTRHNFIEFTKDYEVQESKVKDQLTRISDGHSVKTTDLFSISSKLLEDLGSQSDLFSHLCHLKMSHDVTYTHSLNVSMLCNIFAQWLHLNEADTEALTVAGLLHDIGKTKISSDLLNKPGKLTEEEFEIVKRHTNIGYDMVKDKNIHEGIKQAILLHHEKMNGSGYPFGLSWDKIHPFAKIVSIVDIYDAMTSERTYHKRFSPFKVIQHFEEECYGVLDTEYMYIFLEHIAHNYIGSRARLSTGQVCVIKFIHSQSPSYPIVQIDKDMVDLRQEDGVTIEEIL
ncbi:HD-GYP domain-containing protein [Vallitalea pronyensis]|uniref:HD-GYP domain-containing protein n=1 Tax=Vallitalea pronyensis TaxID=1348613 RepID=A0A8J8MP01_9FIRM|nr:HD-GYP domain-containing protein [Vallitalea pronyensis]QUI25081.1 HD-GYP domain-containing protein [Vallitalea pronyensis]